CEPYSISRYNSFGIFDEITEFRVAIFTQRSMQRDGFAAVFLHFDDFFWSHVQLSPQFFWGWFTTQVLQHLPLDTRQLVNDLDHVNRYTNGASLICHRTGNRLTNPPCRIRGELKALTVVKLLYRAN